MQHLQDLCPLDHLWSNWTSATRLGREASKTLVAVCYLLAEVGSLEGDHADVNCVGDKRLVVHELVGGEGGDGVEEELGGLLEVPDGHAVQTLVDLQAVPAVPVAALLDEAAGGEDSPAVTQGGDVWLDVRTKLYLLAFSVLRVMRSLSM